ncbi:esterase/lipase family protein [Nocardia sp. NPDC020380]|uniref:esterase/lipase family protein n=1 Tax=Nocardia sp. NPDC020380 TaxID=3364309 RepID=UPI0037997E1F
MRFYQNDSKFAEGSDQVLGSVADAGHEGFDMRIGTTIVAMAGVTAVASVLVMHAGPATAKNPADGITACASGTRTQDPVLVVHGWHGPIQGMTSDMEPIAAALQADGRCVYNLDYSSDLGPQTIVGQFTDAVHRILAVNSAQSISLVGHSEGGLIVRAVSMQFPAAANPVDKVVAISGPQTGTGRLSGLSADMTSYIAQLNSGPTPVAASVNYTMVASRDDKISDPPTIGFVDASNVRNIWLQDGCPQDNSGHIEELKDSHLIGIVTNALDPDQHPTIPC